MTLIKQPLSARSVRRQLSETIPPPPSERLSHKRASLPRVLSDMLIVRPGQSTPLSCSLNSGMGQTRVSTERTSNASSAKFARAQTKLKSVVRLKIKRNKDTEGDELGGGLTEEGTGEIKREEITTPEELPEMSNEEKKAMYDAVCEGNIDKLDDLLDLPGADINMEWFGESLLMAAIRAAETEMAAFLIDNDIDRNYETMRLEMRNPNSREMVLYPVTCRQMAYEEGLGSIVDIIDSCNNNSWPFVKTPMRTIRLKRPLEDKLREKREAEEAERRRRYNLELVYKQKNMSQEEQDPEVYSNKDNCSVTSKTSYGSSFTFSDLANGRVEKKKRQPGNDGETEGLENVAEIPEVIDNMECVLQDGGDDEEDEGPFFVPLGPASLFPYPSEEVEEETKRMHMYRSNRAFISRLSSNSQRIQDYNVSNASRSSFSRLLPGKSFSSERVFCPSHKSQQIRHSSSKTRYISPWKDIETTDVVSGSSKRRSKSAGAAVESRHEDLTNSPNSPTVIRSCLAGSLTKKAQANRQHNVFFNMTQAQVVLPRIETFFNPSRHHTLNNSQAKVSSSLFV